MTVQLHPHPVREPLPRHLARWLLARLPGAGAGDLSDALVLLPARRACVALRHALLEESGREALLLPEVTTPGWLAEGLAARLGLPPPALAADLRPLLLARRLADLDWVPGGATAGLAEEVVELADALRLWGRPPAAWRRGEALPDPAALDDGGERLAEALRLFAAAVPRDGADLLLEVLARVAGPPWGAAEAAWPGPPHRVVVAAGFADVDPATVALLQAALRQGEAHLFALSATDLLSRLLLESYPDDGSALHPLAPTRRLLRRLDLPLPERGDGTGPGAVGPSAPAPTAEPAPLPGLLSCADPEAESRTVADLVVRELATAAPGPPPRVVVATADRRLAARVVAQGRDAGLDLEDTGGRPLAETPAGLLAHAILRAAATDLRHDPLLETLTHPFVTLGHARATCERLTLRLERMIRAASPPPASRRDLERLAARHDRTAAELWPGTAGRAVAFVDAIVRALGPLLEAPAAAGWSDLADRFRACWRALAPGRPPAAEPGEGGADPRADLAALDLLLRDLAGIPAGAPGLAGFAADLDRLLGLRVVRPHRPPFAPVQVTGLLEARLEDCDLLVLAGMAEEVFPGRSPAAALVTERERARLGLPGRGERLGRQADLFLRLLHNGRRVVATFPREREGGPCLPSGLVTRLAVAAGATVPAAPAAPLHRPRRDRQQDAVPAEVQRGFLAEPVPIPTPPGYRPPRRLSHTALRSFRDCPYKFLLESGYRLREQEIVEEFQRRDFGRAAHLCLKGFLEPGSEGDGALGRGDREQALALLLAQIDLVFEERAPGLPQRRLWARALAAVAPDLVAAELERRRIWRPVALEAGFSLGLGDLRDWLARQDGGDRSGPPPDLPPAAAGLLIEGRIDRLDRDASGALAVLDYKTGSLPARKEIDERRELQVLLYALAVEAGEVPDLGPRPAGASPRRVVEGGYHQVSPSGLQVVQGDLADLRDGRGRALLVEGARDLLALVPAAAAGGEFALVPEHWSGRASGPLPCRHCSWLGVCRLQERDAPAAVREGVLRLVSASRRRG